MPSRSLKRMTQHISGSMSASNTSEHYEAIVLGGGKGGKTLATELGNNGVKTALIERSADMIGGSCINAASQLRFQNLTGTNRYD